MPKPYETIGSTTLFRLPNGKDGSMKDVITIDDRGRYVEEVKLIQMALGVAPDGIIGPDTRHAAQRIAMSNSEAK